VDIPVGDSIVSIELQVNIVAVVGILFGDRRSARAANRARVMRAGDAPIQRVIGVCDRPFDRTVEELLDLRQPLAMVPGIGVRFPS
jgi:hypothetical protein